MKHWSLVVFMAVMIAALTGWDAPARAQQKTLPKISAPTNIGPKPPVGSGGCSVTAPTCAEVAPTIIKSALGPSPLEANLRYLTGVNARRGSASPADTHALRWAVEAFRKAGVDWVHAEPYTARAGTRQAPGKRAGRQLRAANVVAEIRGREKPEEFVILAAPLDPRGRGASAVGRDAAAAMVIDAARAIHAAGTRPLRSIRFILFTGEEQGMMGSWAYARAHRAELDHADAVIVYDSGAGPVTGYDLEGRPEIEARLREALAPAAQFGADHDSDAAQLRTDGYDFLLEGVPTLVPIQGPTSRHAPLNSSDKAHFTALKREEALAALTAYGIADLPERLGARQTRGEIGKLLERTGLEEEMKMFGIWKLWEQGERGRQR